MKANVTQVMSDEHQLILRMIALVDKNTALMEQESFHDWTFFLDAVDFIRNYADRFHRAKEEDVLFIEPIRNGMPEKNSPIEAMHMEHDQGRAYVCGIEAAAQRVLNGEDGQVPVIAENAKGYAELLRGHIDKEDTIHLSARRAGASGSRSFRDAECLWAGRGENPRSGKKYRQMVEHHEQQDVS